jgi:hypothetical protein
MTYEIIGGYLACSITAFWLLQHETRRELDFTISGAIFSFIIAALGPAGLFSALVVRASHLPIPWDKVILPRRRK